MIVQRMKLGSLQDPDRFIEFMRDRFLPAMRRGPTRIGQASYIELLQGNTHETLDEFVLLVDGLMHFHPAFVGHELETEFERFGVRLEGPNGDLHSVDMWHETTDADQAMGGAPLT